MADKKNVASRLPLGAQDIAKSLWNHLSPADRSAIEEIIEAFPSQTNLMQLLLRQASGQIKMAFGHKERVVIVGPTNVGKSTLYNQLIQRKEDKAAVSPLPGTTRVNQQSDTGLFTVVDTPGADAVGEKGAQEQEFALSAAANSDFIIIVFDAIQGIKRTELDLFDRLAGSGKPYIVVLNKIDLVRKERQQVIDGAASALRLQPDQIIPVVAKTGEGLNDILIAIALAEPEIVAALGRALPQYRWQLAWRVIVSGASASAVIALTPLPVVDFIPLIATQSIMVLSIARIYAYDITLQRARELVATFGIGFLGRMVFEELSKLGGIPGWLLSAAIAASTTFVMGYAASVWFETGEKLSADTLKRLTSDITSALLATLRGVGKTGPNKKTLKEQIELTFQNMPFSKDRTQLDQRASQTDPSEAPK